MGNENANEPLGWERLEETVRLSDLRVIKIEKPVK
jgi:hypothetical protein